MELSFKEFVSSLFKNNIKSITDVGPNQEEVSVSSSAIDTVGYDLETKTLTIRFNSGSTYEYPLVPEYIYEGIVQSSSVGKSYNFLIKDTIYGLTYDRV